MNIAPTQNVKIATLNKTRTDSSKSLRSKPSVFVTHQYLGNCTARSLPNSFRRRLLKNSWHEESRIRATHCASAAIIAKPFANAWVCHSTAITGAQAAQRNEPSSDATAVPLREAEPPLLNGGSSENLGLVERCIGAVTWLEVAESCSSKSGIERVESPEADEKIGAWFDSLAFPCMPSNSLESSSQSLLKEGKWKERGRWLSSKETWLREEMRSSTFMVGVVLGGKQVFKMLSKRVRFERQESARSMTERWEVFYLAATALEVGNSRCGSVGG